MDFFLLKKPGYFSLNMDALISPKKWTPDYFSTIRVSILVNRSLLGVLLNHWMINAGFYNPTEDDVEHLQICKLNSAISSTLFPRR